MINICASGYLRDIFSSLESSIVIADYVHEHEVSILRKPSDSGVTSKVDLQPYIACGLITIASLESDNENFAFVNFAVDLDDGEAITCAIAINRNWAMATDDRRSVAYLRRHVPSLPIVSTLDILKHWADTSSPSATDIQMAIHSIRTQASYYPGINHPLYAWCQLYVKQS